MDRECQVTQKTASFRRKTNSIIGGSELKFFQQIFWVAQRRFALMSKLLVTTSSFVLLFFSRICAVFHHDDSRVPYCSFFSVRHSTKWHPRREKPFKHVILLQSRHHNQRTTYKNIVVSWKCRQFSQYYIFFEKNENFRVKDKRAVCCCYLHDLVVLNSILLSLSTPSECVIIVVICKAHRLTQFYNDENIANCWWNLVQ